MTLDKPVTRVLTHELGNDTPVITLKDVAGVWQFLTKALSHTRTSGHVDVPVANIPTVHYFVISST